MERVADATRVIYIFIYVFFFLDPAEFSRNECISQSNSPVPSLTKNTENPFSLCTSSDNRISKNQIGLLQSKPESVEICSSFQRKSLSDDSSDEENSDVDILGDDKTYIT